MRKLDFGFTEEQKMLRKTARHFVDEEIMPHIQRWDAEGGFDPGNLEEACGYGFMGVCIPEQYGGSGMDYNSLAIIV